MKDYRRQAKLSARTAHLALEAGDVVSALSRAYYAMFDGARAMLAVTDPEFASAKTHATVLRRFSKHIVKEGGFDRKYSRMLRKAFEIRQLSDYDADPPAAGQAAEILQMMDDFIAAVEAKLADDTSDGLSS